MTWHKEPDAGGPEGLRARDTLFARTAQHEKQEPRKMSPLEIRGHDGPFCKDSNQATKPTQKFIEQQAGIVCSDYVAALSGRANDAIK